ncbi:MAG: segregation/condensation protein A [Deltaproteobacteria bacterium]|nr:segregation/condensation protein A [Deltaproteobacteria bacterium]
MAYNVKLDIFEGPLDLLLHLIKKNEVDIYDIPIAFITEQYLEYIEIIKEMNLDIAGEFLVVAATLVHIKSKMLLPVDEDAVAEEDEGVDPRAELVARLLEYQRYREAAVELNGRLLLGRDVFGKGAPVPLDGLEDEAGYKNVSVFELMEALKGVLARAPAERIVDMAHERFRIADKINSIMESLATGKSMTFTELFRPGASRSEIIVTFLAILEIAKLLLARIHQTDDGVIRVYAPAQTADVAPLLAAVTSDVAPDDTGADETGGD